MTTLTLNAPVVLPLVFVVAGGAVWLYVRFDGWLDRRHPTDLRFERMRRALAVDDREYLYDDSGELVATTDFTTPGVKRAEAKATIANALCDHERGVAGHGYFLDHARAAEAVLQRLERAGVRLIYSDAEATA